MTHVAHPLTSLPSTEDVNVVYFLRLEVAGEGDRGTDV